ncbi:MAG: T9SS type A sorting domain-containing protein [Chitinophagales bacterium]|jgi:hypothetical protein|nr:T9SS type A sorting domain-containing protein [Chitinophagales bacterium]
MKTVALFVLCLWSALGFSQETYLHEIAAKKAVSLKRLESIQDSLIKHSKLFKSESISAKVDVPHHLLMLGLSHKTPEHFEISIVNEEGTEFLHKAIDFDPSKHDYTFDIHSLSPGFYYMRIYSEKTFLIRKFLLQK